MARKNRRPHQPVQSTEIPVPALQDEKPATQPHITGYLKQWMRAWQLEKR